MPCVSGTPDADARDHWYRCDHDLPPGALLEFQGLATTAEVWIDGGPVASGNSMFRRLLVTVPQTGGAGIEVRIRALRPPRGTRRARWRNRLIAGESLRTVRTSLLGRMPGTGDPVAGPFRPIVLHPPGTIEATLRTAVEDGQGVVRLRLAGALSGTLEAAGHAAPLSQQGTVSTATLRIPDPPLWWPHTHGTPELVDVTLRLEGQAITLGRTGFRTIATVPGHGLALVVNGVPVFCRGAVWMGGGLEGLEQARDAGMNMVRVPGFTRYPDTAFMAACDALGLLVWQDFMFARFDYPDDAAFLDAVREEATELLEATGAHPCLAVLCGGDETVQAAAMAGRPPSEWAHPVFDTVLPAVAARLRPDVPYVPNAPHGDALPFAKSAPVSHYFGVGAYLRPLADAAGVRFAAASLAFANPEDPAGCRALSATPGDEDWRRAVPRDPGVAWDFEDVRDHYAAALFGCDPALLRRTDPEQWLATGRAAVALAMQGAFAQWRTDPRCGGALVLGLQDVVKGPGWGVLGQDGRPKSALHALAQVFRPVQVLLVDGGLDGVAVHMVNERAAPCTVHLLLRGLDAAGAVTVLVSNEHALEPRGRTVLTAAALMGRFQDLTGAWRFGPAPFTVLGAMLSIDGALVSEATLFPGGPARPRMDVGLAATVSAGPPWRVELRARHFAQFVQIDDEACIPAEDNFHLWPGEPRTVALRGDFRPGGAVTALNGLVPAHYRGPS